MTDIIIYFSGILCLAYICLMLLYRKGWKKQSTFRMADDYIPSTKISLIIPARNEEQNISKCIESSLQQDYPKALYEIIVIDDHSTDNTANIVQSYADRGVRYISLAKVIAEQEVTNAYKKQALTTGIANSTGELIVTTDADCYAGTEWLRTVAARYEQDRPVMIVAPVDFTTDNSTVQLFQSLDFMSMQGITVASLQLKMGNMSNGANLAFTKAAFNEVNGYTGVDHLASGDDYLLMMKLNKQFGGNKLVYLKSQEAIVRTAPQPGWRSFLQQRIRWASKSGKYDDQRVTMILLLVYLFNCSFLLLIFCSFISMDCFAAFVVMLIVKTVVELYFLAPVARFYGKKKQLRKFPLLQPLHITYIILAGLLGFVGVYTWKGRKVK